MQSVPSLNYGQIYSILQYHLIEIDQDVLGKQAYCIRNCHNSEPTYWKKEISGNRQVYAFTNEESESWKIVKQIFPKLVRLREVFLNTESLHFGISHFTIPPHGIRIFVVEDISRVE